MSNPLKKAIEDKLEKQSLNIAELERLAGLKMNAVRNIITGRSKKPSADTIQAIAKALGCSVDTLLQQSGNIEGNSSNNEDSNKADIKLFIDACLVVIKELEANLTSSNLSLSQLFDIIKDSYQYSIQLKLKHADQNFSKWLISQKTNLSNS